MSFYRSKLKSAKKPVREHDVDDLFGSISSHPSTVPVAKTTKLSHHLLRDIFDDSFDSTKSSLGQRQSHSVFPERYFLQIKLFTLTKSFLTCFLLSLRNEKLFPEPKLNQLKAFSVVKNKGKLFNFVN